jgi:hypothetical protein
MSPNRRATLAELGPGSPAIIAGPVFSPDNRHVALAISENETKALAVDGARSGEDARANDTTRSSDASVSMTIDARSGTPLRPEQVLSASPDAIA